MPTETQLRDLLLRWEELRKQGQAVSAADLCGDCPELAESLQKQIDALEDVDRVLETGPAEARGTLHIVKYGDTTLSRQPPTPTPAPVELSDLQRASPEGPRSWKLADLKPGVEPVPGYILVERIGSGGFGEVWKATAPGGFPIAMKFVPQLGQGMMIEMRALEIIKSLRHPNLLSTFGAWQLPGMLVIAMELADRTLGDRFHEAASQGLPGIPREELLEYLQEAAKGIDYLNGSQHVLEGKLSLGVQHRDIKPQNILLVGRGVKVADFGLVRILEHAVTAHTGSMTPGYAAPEFMRGKTSSRSDQYSLAAMYCELRGGQLPFRGSVEQVLLGHLEGTPDLSMLPEAERPIVARALAKGPDDRWPSCREFVVALAGRAGDVASPPAKRAKSATGSRGPSHALIAFVSAAVFAVVAFVALDERNDPEPNRPINNNSVVKDTEQDEQTPTIDAETSNTERKSAQPTVAEVAVAAADSTAQPGKEPVGLEPTPTADTPVVEATQPPGLPEGAKVAAANSPVIETPAVTRPGYPVGELMCFREHRGGVRAVAFSSDNQHAISAGEDTVLRLWDASTGREVHQFKEEHATTVNCVALSPDSKRAISGDEDAVLVLWDVENKTKLRRLIGHHGTINSAAFSQDGSRTLSASDDGTVLVWNADTGEPAQRIEIPGEAIWSAVFGPEDRQVVLSSMAAGSHSVRLCDLASGAPVKRFDGLSDIVLAVAYSSKSGQALTAGGDQSKHQDYTLRLWDLERTMVLKRLAGHEGSVGSMAISPDGRRALSGSADATVRYWDLETGQELHRFEDHTSGVYCVAFSPDGRRAVSASKDRTVRVWGLPR